MVVETFLGEVPIPLDEKEGEVYVCKTIHCGGIACALIRVEFIKALMG